MIFTAIGAVGEECIIVSLKKEYCQGRIRKKWSRSECRGRPAS